MAVNRYYSSSAIDTTLQDGIDASATEIRLASTAGMPQSYPFTLAIGFDLSTEEIVNVVGAGSVANSYKVGLIVGTASVSGRGVDGSTAQSHAAGVAVKHVFTARDMREAQEHINATGKYTVINGSQTEDQDLHGIGTGEGSVVGTAKTQTLTNKTISGAQNTITSIAQASVTNLTSDLALKAPLASPTFTGTVTLPTGTVTSAMIADGVIVNADINANAAIDWTKLAISSTVSATEIGYVDGVTSSIQTQIDTLTNNLSSAVPTGVVSAFAGSSAPTGYLLCDGTAVSRTTYSALFNVIGTTYGAGDSSTTFNLPNLKGRVGVGRDAAQTEFDGLGETGGAKAVAITVAQMPSYNHEFQYSSDGGNGSTYFKTSGGPYSGSLFYPHGSGEAHNNLQPYLVLNYIIKH